jgi:thioredoxin reductase (NADPH)
MDIMEEQARTYGAEIKTGIDVASIEQKEYKFYVKSKHETFIGRSVVASTDSNYRILGIPGEDDLIGSGVHFCATCDGAFYIDREVVVIGGGNSALEEGIFLSNFFKKVHIVHRVEEFSASSTYVEKLLSIDNVETYMDKEAIEFVADEDGKFKGLEVRDNESNKEELIESDGAFIFIGLVLNTNNLKAYCI